MHEVVGELWDYLGKGVVAITTNGAVTRDARAVFGHGTARQAGERFPGLDLRLGQAILAGGNHVHELGDGLVSFPVEDSPWSLPDLTLIGRSARELRELADRRQWQLVVVPRPGCGGGGLSWRDVKPLLAGYFDGRFHMITAGPGERT